jgi:hypothetical protein
VGIQASSVISGSVLRPSGPDQASPGGYVLGVRKIVVQLLTMCV